MKRTVEINDTLSDTVESACDDVKAEAIRWLDDNGDDDTDEAPDLGNDLDYSGAIHEIVDGATPIYNGEIADLWYLYSDRFEQALNNTGFETTPDNRQQIAIFCYLEQEIGSWYEDHKEEIFDEWRAAHPVKEDEEDELTKPVEKR
jgi:hypothetical protein